MQQTVLTVSQVNGYIKDLMERDGFLSGLTISGELSNYKVYPSGHHYFSLKDAEGALRCVMFKGSAMRLRFRPENGMRVLAVGRISVFPRDGAYQLYCTGLVPDGVGDLYTAFEQLKEKLFREGLFDSDHKQPIPAYPHRIAIITSSAGAAIHDMLRILAKRYPLSKVIVMPVRVQGVEAPAEICGAIRYANRFRIADLIITGRGGGSMEDLWAFNDERVARTIAASQIPVISAVGHEPDVTISDFVADLRAATPSNAAELAVPDQTELRETLLSLQNRLTQRMRQTLLISQKQLEQLRSKRVLQSPMNYLQDQRMILDHRYKRLSAAAEKLLLTKRQTFIRLTAGLEAMSPLKVLSRGYSMTRDSAGKLLTDSGTVQPGDSISVTLQHGSLQAQVTATDGGTP